MIYSVSYDLHSDDDREARCERVLQALRQLGVLNRCLKSTYLLQTEATSSTVYDAVRNLMVAGDRFFVAPIEKDLCVGVTTRSDQVWDWLRNHS